MDNPSKVFIYKKWSLYQKLGAVLSYCGIKVTIGQCESSLMEANCTSVFLKKVNIKVSYVVWNIAMKRVYLQNQTLIIDNLFIQLFSSLNQLEYKKGVIQGVPK